MQNVEIISEIGSIHDGSFGNAKCAIKASKLVGCDTVKFQFHIAEEETTRYAKNPAYFDGEDRFSYFERTAFDANQWLELMLEAKKNQIQFLVSPFSVKAIDILQGMGVNYFKVASGEVTNLQLLERLNQSNFKIILSSGMANWQELKTACGILSNVKELTVLQCTSSYPCPLERIGLNLIGEIKNTLKVDRVGLSDHSSGFSAAIGAVYHGAQVLEKHFSFSRLMYGSDAQFGETPDEFKKLVSYVREAEKLNNSPIDKTISDEIHEMKSIFEKSIVAKRDLEVGKILEENDLALKKPGTGLGANYLKNVIGKRLKVKCKVDDQISLDFLND